MSALTQSQKDTLLAGFREMEPRMLEGIRRNLRIPSEKSAPQPGAPFGPGPRAALEDALTQARELGFRTCSVGDKIGYAEIGEGSEMVACLGHLDVVPAGDGWQHGPYEAHFENGVLWGRGSMDDKGPILGALYGLKVIADSGIPLKRRIRVILGTDEESGSACVAHYKSSGQEMPAAGFTPDADFPAIFCEKGILGMVLGCPLTGADAGITLAGGVADNVVMPSLTLEAPAALAGRLPADKTEKLGDRVRCTFVGRSAHASTPEKGVNAAYLATEALRGVQLAPAADRLLTFIREKLRGETDGRSLGIAAHDEETGDLTLNLGRIFTEKGRLCLSLDLRYPPCCKAEKVMDAIAARAAGCGLEVLEQDCEKPLYIPRDAPLIRSLMEVYRDRTGDCREPIAIGGGTYAKAFPNMVAFGPLFPGEPDIIHQPNERVDWEKLKKSIEISMLAMAELANGDL